MNLDNLSSWLRLQQVPKLGDRTIARLASHFNSPIDILNTSAEKLEELGFQPKLAKAIRCSPEVDLESIERWLELSEENFVLTFSDSDYPPLLKQIPDPPAVLYGIGSVDSLNTPQLAIVGTRKPTPHGVELAGAFSSQLAEIGISITSGLAMGVDGIAHRAAIMAGGTTIAVAGTGLDRVYPRMHRSLAHDIASSGALLSEFPLGTTVHSSHFPKRNRIISGLSLGVLVIEAAQKSGSLITARLAAEQGREVFAIPGSVANLQAKGCHRLIKDGATLTEGVEDILKQLGWLARAQMDLSNEQANNQVINDLESSESELLYLIDFAPTDLDQLVVRSQKSVAELSSILLTLELKGCIAQTSSGFQRIK